MSSPASEVARRLGENAEAVCRRYLSNGRREGHYWMVGDISNSPGRSLYVRLASSANGGAPGKWTDAASGDHGDLLDVIAASCGHTAFRETLEEARRFLSMPPPPEAPRNPAPAKAPTGSPESARRLLAATKPLKASLGEAYLVGRSITDILPDYPLRFHPHCFYRASSDDARGGRPAWPAMIAVVTDLAGTVTGVHRTWLDPETNDKAPIAYPRRAMGDLLGNGVRFGASGRVMAAGEGIETILSLRQVMPTLPMISGLSGAHLAAIAFPDMLKRLYVARDDDPAGDAALATLSERASQCGIDVLPLEPRHGDFNGDLRAVGRAAMAASLRSQLLPADRLKFL
ncbi:MAG: toprim domain-containing protein [Sphingopyxis sp.]